MEPLRLAHQIPQDLTARRLLKAQRELHIGVWVGPADNGIADATVDVFLHQRLVQEQLVIMLRLQHHVVLVGLHSAKAFQVSVACHTTQCSTNHAAGCTYLDHEMHMADTEVFPRPRFVQLVQLHAPTARPGFPIRQTGCDCVGCSPSNTASATVLASAARLTAMAHRRAHGLTRHADIAVGIATSVRAVGYRALASVAGALRHGTALCLRRLTRVVPSWWELALNWRR